MIKRTQVWAIGLAATLAWGNLAASQEPPKRPMPPRVPEGVKVLRDLQYVEGGHERRLRFKDIRIQELARGPTGAVPSADGGFAKAAETVSRPTSIPSVKALADQLPCTLDFFDVRGCPAFLIRPKGEAASSPVPWVWYAPVIGHPNTSHAWMLRQWLEKGIGMAGVDVGESCGSPQGRKVYTALWETLTTRYRMSERPCLLPQSRGGLMLYNWAVENPGAWPASRGSTPYATCEAIRDWSTRAAFTACVRRSCRPTSPSTIRSTGFPRWPRPVCRSSTSTVTPTRWSLWRRTPASWPVATVPWAARRG